MGKLFYNVAVSTTLKNPVVAYEADTNVQAHIVRTMLEESGIPAFVIEDVSYAGTCSLGTLPGINKPQVWVERKDLQAAQELTREFDDKNLHREEESAERDFCFHCGEPVECGQGVCPSCGERIDDLAEGKKASPNQFSDQSIDESDGEEVSTLEGYRRWKRPIAFVLLLPFLCSVALLVFGAFMMLVELIRSAS